MNIKNKILVTFFILIVSDTFSQVNHVLNYSFEQHTACSIIGECTGGTPVNNWFCPEGFINWYCSPCFGSPSSQGVPENAIGYQFARTGESYGAIVADTENADGYLTGTLFDSLKPTVKYCVTFYVSLGDSCWWAFSSIGAYLSNDSICTGNYNVLPYIPQIENPSTDTIKDKINWTQISGEFQANGGEKFITLGNFHTLTRQDFDTVGPGGKSYGLNSEVQTDYYVDDVYVRMLTIANAGKEDTICNGDGVIIGKDTTTTGVSFHWLPVTGLSNPNIAQQLASPTVTTTYTLTVVNDSIHGCNCADSITKDSVTVFVYPAINVTSYFVNDTGSNSGSAGVYITGGSKPYTYLWKPNGQTTDSITGLGASIDTCIITDANGCAYTTKIVVKNTTGINDIKGESEKVKVFPNPNNGNFTIAYQLKNGQIGKLELFDAIGENVGEYILPNTSGSLSVSNPNLRNGVYVYKVITNDNSVKVGRIVIIK